MAIISKELGYLYLPAPGAASTTISEYLLKNCKGQWIPENDILDERNCFLVQKKHSTISELLAFKVLDQETLDSLYKFTSTRNPFAHFVAEWKRSRISWISELRNPNSWVFKSPGKLDEIIFAAKHDFSEWIEILFGNRYEAGEKLHLYGDYLKGVDYVIKSENLEQGLQIVLQSINMNTDKKITSFNINAENNLPYWQYYTCRAREIIYSIFEPDFQNFGYIF